MPEAVPGAGGAGQMPEAASTRWKAPRRLMKWGAGIQEVGIPEGHWGHLGTLFLFQTSRLPLISNQPHFGWCLKLQTQKSCY